MAVYAFAQNYHAKTKKLEELEKEMKRQQDEAAKKAKRQHEEAEMEAKRQRNEGKSNSQLQDEFWRDHYIELQK